MADAINVARAHGDDNIAWLTHGFELFDNGGEGVEVHGANTAGAQAINEIASRDLEAFFFGIAHEVDLGNDDHISVRKAHGELVQEVAGARMLVWLEDADQAAIAGLRRFGFAQGLQGDINFGWMMAIVVKDADGVGSVEASIAFGHTAAQELHSAVDALVFGERLGEFFWIGPDVQPKDKGGRGISGVVAAWNCVAPGCDLDALARDANQTSWNIERDNPIRGGIEADCFNRTLGTRDNFAAMGVVVSDQEFAALGFGGEHRGELAEGLDDLADVFVHVEMVGFDTGDAGEGGREIVEGAVVFTGFGD